MTHEERWGRYGRAVIGAMSEVLDEVPEEAKAHVLETADYWLSVGLVPGIEHPEDAARLLELIETDEQERAALSGDGAVFLEDALP